MTLFLKNDTDATEVEINTLSIAASDNKLDLETIINLSENCHLPSATTSRTASLSQLGVGCGI